MTQESAPTPKPKKAKGKRKRARRASREPSERARASIANGALGRKFAGLLKEPHSHQLGVCGKLGIPYSTHKRWMADEEPTKDIAAYQAEVLKGLDKQRMLDLDRAKETLDQCHPAKAGAYFNLFKFSHENRFRRFQADENAQKHLIEHTGKDGGPIESESRVRYVMKVPQEEPEEE